MQQLKNYKMFLNSTLSLSDPLLKRKFISFFGEDKNYAKITWKKDETLLRQEDKSEYSFIVSDAIIKQLSF